MCIYSMYVHMHVHMCVHVHIRTYVCSECVCETNMYRHCWEVVRARVVWQQWQLHSVLIICKREGTKCVVNNSHKIRIKGQEEAVLQSRSVGY